MDQTEYRIVAKQSFLPVTSLEFVSIGNSELLLIGEGPNLKLFSKDGQLQCEEQVLPFRRVHGIRPAPPSVHSAEDHSLLLVFGQKGFRLINLQTDSKQLKCISTVFESLDWILDVCWLNFCDASNFSVSLLTAHNALTVYKVTNGAIHTVTFHNETNCMLYSARLLRYGIDELIVASGTVFNQILLWKLSLQSDPSQKVMVKLCLVGHEGVIFSVRMADDHNRLVSVSDDRTIRVWTLPPSWKSLEKVGHCVCPLVLYGHTARVWDAKLLPYLIVSVGEDATCRLWSYSGQCLHVIEGHKGKSIWSMSVDIENKLVATGGGDCSIRVFNIEQLVASKHRKFDSCLPTTGASCDDAPRSVCLFGQTALCLTSDGVLYAAQLPMGNSEVEAFACNWKETSNDPSFSGYCVIAFCGPLSVLALGNLKGFIKLLQLCEKGTVLQETEWKAHEGKVFSLDWFTMTKNKVSHLLFSCGPEGKVMCWHCDTLSKLLTITLLATFELPPSKHRWISAVLVLDESHPPSSHMHNVKGHTDGSLTATKSNEYTFIFGDRKGCVHTYKSRVISLPLKDLDQSLSHFTYTSPIQSYPVHGPNGVTCITYHQGFVFSTGRNGYCRKYALNDDGSLSELTKFKPVKGMYWIEELLFTDDDLLVLGFHTTEMILYSTKQNKHIARINCGGGHRSYGINSREEMFLTKMIHVVFIKQSMLCIRAASLASYFTKPVLQQAFVGREAISLEIIGGNPDTGDLLIAVGSEDCTVCLTAVSPLNSSLCVLKTLTGHLSCVKALGSSESCLARDRRLLFSGGARASLKAWSIPCHQSLATNKEDVVHVGEVSLHDKPYSRKSKSKMKEPGAADIPECRIMSLVSIPLKSFATKGLDHCLHYVAAGCSDGLIRQFIYSEETSKFQSQGSLGYHDRCILCVKHFRLTTQSSTQSLCTEASNGSKNCIYSYLCSSATDGCVVIWELNPVIKRCLMGIVENQDSVKRPVESVSKSSPAPAVVFRAHQSGINDIAVYCEGKTCSIATVGDDNALTVTTLTMVVDPCVSFTVDSQCSNLSAHSSSITGVHFIQSDLVMTTSIDQRLSVWRTKASKALITLSSSYTHDVADVACLRIYQHSEFVTAVFCGVGLQYFCLGPLSAEKKATQTITS